MTVRECIKERTSKEIEKTTAEKKTEIMDETERKKDSGHQRQGEY